MPKATRSEKFRPGTSRQCPTTSTSKEIAATKTAIAAGPSKEGGQTSTSGEQCEKPGECSTSGEIVSKRKLDSEPGALAAPERQKKKGKREMQTSPSESGPSPSSKPNIRKLIPPRPFPTVPTSSSATGPRSAHVEGKNRICITRKTELGMYLRRCKDVVLKDGYKTLHLHAMGAAIPHLARLAVSLPPILPFAASDIQTEVRTGTAEVQDEVIPDDEDEDITLRTRGKSTMSVTIKIEGGDDECTIPTTKRDAKGKGKIHSGNKKRTKVNTIQPEQLVFTEADLEDDDTQS